MDNNVILDAGLLHRLEEIKNYDLRTQAICQYTCAVRDEAGVGYFSTEKFMWFMDRVRRGGKGFRISVANNGAWRVNFHWGPYNMDGHAVRVQFNTSGSVDIFVYKVNNIDKSRRYSFKEIFSVIDKVVPKNVVVLDVPALD